MDPQQFYFRQLLSGRDFAVGDPIATQMVNFVYAIGDRATGECVLVDPAYAVNDLLDVIEGDGMRCTGVLATHYHPDHVGGSMMGFTIEGVAALLNRTDCPIHVQRHEAPWVMRTTGLDEAAAVAMQTWNRTGNDLIAHLRTIGVFPPADAQPTITTNRS